MSTEEDSRQLYLRLEEERRQYESQRDPGGVTLGYGCGCLLLLVAAVMLGIFLTGCGFILFKVYDLVT